MPNKKISKKLNCLKTMPPVSHSIPGENFSYQKSEFVQWVLEQKTILDWLCQCLMNSKLIEYNKELKKWQGIDYDNTKK